MAGRHALLSLGRRLISLGQLGKVFESIIVPVDFLDILACTSMVCTVGLRAQRIGRNQPGAHLPLLRSSEYGCWDKCLFLDFEVGVLTVLAIRAIVVCVEYVGPDANN
jgi:hypothetical protein